MTTTMPGPPSILFLAYVLFVLPWAAFRSARMLRTVNALPSGELVWIQTIVMLALLFGLAWFVGTGFGYDPFAPPAKLGLREWGATAAALLACFAVRAIARATRPAAERRSLLVYRIAPRTPRQWALWALTIVAASIAEETAYRGVGMQILWYMLGTPWMSALICAVAFGLAHAVQGTRSAVLVTIIGLVMHALVYITGTLLLAMLVHAVYDFVAGYWIAREAQTMSLPA